MIKTNIPKIIGGVIIAIFALIVLASTFFSIQYGTIGVMTRFGKIIGEPLNPGLHVKVPFVDQVIMYRTQKVIYETLANPNEGESNADYQDYAVDTTTKDGQQVSVRYTVRFSVDPTKVKAVAENLGTESELVEKIVKTDSRIWVRNLPREYTAIDLYTGNVEIVSEKIFEALKPRFEANGILLDEFGIRSINFQADYVSAVEQKQVEKEKVTTEQYIAQQEEFKKKGLITKAEGEAAAQKLQQATLSNALIKKLWIEKWNGILPTTMAGANSSFLIDLYK
ncbi:prohibitin family protein [Candidatus Dojkabacteria bacterium]|jgi:regulator of protease activity HflC (stomatin/prohibitin superfamily)|nr:prohibitin family protein [Candidatus Dojkabacteria bacterium]